MPDDQWEPERLQIEFRVNEDDLVFMADGLVVERGPPRTVLANPQEPRTREFLSRVL